MLNKLSQVIRKPRTDYIFFQKSMLIHKQTESASFREVKEFILSQVTATTYWRRDSMSRFFKEPLVTITGGLLIDRPERIHAITQWLLI